MAAKLESKTVTTTLHGLNLIFQPKLTGNELTGALITLAQAIPKNNKEVLLYLTLTEEQTVTVNQIKNITELIETGKCFMNSTDYKGSYCVTITELNYGLIKPFIAQFIKPATQTEAKNNVAFASTLNHKKGFLQTWVTKLFVGINLSKAPLALTAVQTSTYQTLQQLAINQPLKQLGVARLLGHKVVALQTETDAKTTKLPSVASLVSLSFWLRWFWFFVLPIKLLKEKNNQSLTEILNLPSNNLFIYRTVFMALCVLVLIAMPWLSFGFGTTWDELIQKNYANDMLKYFLSFGEDKTCLDTTKHLYNNMIYYGSFFDLLASAFYNTTGLLGEYESRHFLNAIFGAVAIIYTGMIARELGNWRTATFALLLILLTPGFFGHAMNNPKDIPFATAYVFAIYQLIKFIKQLPKPKPATVVYLCLGIALAISIRIGGLLLIAYMAMFMFLRWVELVRKNNLKEGINWLQPFASKFFIIAIGAYVLGILFWPYALQNPLKNPLIALQNFSNFSGLLYTYEMFDGARTYMAQVPWYYLPKLLFIGLPVVLWSGLALFVLLSWRVFAKQPVLLVFLVLFVLVFPPAYAIYKKSMLYNGWRHFIFIVPIMAVVAALGWEALLGLTKNKWAQMVGIAALLVGCSLPLKSMITNYPNVYVYFNEFAGGMKKTYGKYELDYYSNSCRAAAEWIVNQETPNKKLLIGINNEPVTASYYAQKINPNAGFQWVREYEEFKPRWDYLILTPRTFSKAELENGSFPPKGTVHTINVDGYPICAVVKRENTFMPDGYDAFARKNMDSAIYFFTQAIAYDPKNEEPYRMLGTAYMYSNNFEEAEKYFNQSIVLFPENYSTYSLLGQMWYQRQQPDKALPYLAKGITLKKNLSEAYFYAGQCEMQKNNFSGAAYYFEEGTKNNGVIPEMYYGLGIANLNLGSLFAAEEALMGAITLNQNYAPAYMALAQVFQRKNEPEKAQECIKRYQQLSGGR